MPPRLRDLLATALLIALPVSTGAQEIILALLLALAVVSGGARAAFALPWTPAAVTFAGTWTLGALARGDVHEALGHAWLLAPFLALGALDPSGPGAERRRTLGLAAAAAAAAYAIVQAARGAAAAGTMSHHLTLAYALLPPFGVALARRRWGFAAVIGAGVLATRSDAAPAALAATTLVALGLPAAAGLALGAVATLTGLAGFAPAGDLQQRAVLWTGGLSVPPGTAGAGGYRAASAPLYDRLQPGFWYPNHAHDTFVQLGATLGAGGWAAATLLVATLFGAATPGAAAGLVGVLVGGLTQDTFGDLEVVRAAWIWVMIEGTASVRGGRSRA